MVVVAKMMVVMRRMMLVMTIVMVMVVLMLVLVLLVVVVINKMEKKSGDIFGPLCSDLRPSSGMSTLVSHSSPRTHTLLSGCS